MATNFIDYNLPKNAYTAFDAVSLKALAIQKLKESNVFTDQAFESSNLSAIIDLIAYSFHVSLFYQNTQGAEADFNQVELYENMNKIINWFDYKPLGWQTSIVPFEAVAQASLPVSNYIIPRFSSIASNGVIFSTAADIYFEKTTSEEETLESIGLQNLLYQGQFREYPQYVAVGEEFEIVTIVDEPVISINAQTSFIDNDNIYVFVKDVTTNAWREWIYTPSLYSHTSNDFVFEKRLNESGRYTLKFGDNINGHKLNTGDVVAIYYLKSSGSQGIVSAGAINGKNLVRFNTQQFRTITADIYTDQSQIISQPNLLLISITNTSKSTDYKTLETVDEIRKNLPSVFQSQNRMVTVRDFDTQIRRNFSNIITDVSVVNNELYTSSYIDYFYQLGLAQPNDNNLVLLNQVAFADACDFNNIYTFIVPKNFLVDGTTPETLPTALKQLIVDKLTPMKMESVEIVPSEPVYIAIDVCSINQDEALTVDKRENSFLLITRQQSSRISLSQIKTSVNLIVTEFFNASNQRLGNIIDVDDLSKRIASIPGVSRIDTVRVDGSQTVVTPGLNLIAWNPFYEAQDVSIINKNTQLPFYKFAFLYNADKFVNKIVVE